MQRENQCIAGYIFTKLSVLSVLNVLSVKPTLSKNNSKSLCALIFILSGAIQCGVLSIKTKVLTHEGVNVYKVNVRGQTFYKSDFVYGEAIAAKTLDEVVKKITTKHAAGDTRVQVLVHEGVNIYQVTEGGKSYYISDPVYDETITGDTVAEVAHDITVKHAMVGGF